MVAERTHAVPIDDIQIDGGTQTRAGLNDETVAEYAAAMEDGAVFPPVVLFYDGTRYWLADGFHRLAAARKLQFRDFLADVHQGTRRDAVLFSVGANANHGLRRTNADKRRGVEVLLQDEEWSRWSDREIADRCGVSHPFVSSIRKELSGNGYQMGGRTAERNGSTYTINTDGINAGRQKAERTSVSGFSPDVDPDPDEVLARMVGATMAEIEEEEKPAPAQPSCQSSPLRYQPTKEEAREEARIAEAARRAAQMDKPAPLVQASGLAMNIEELANSPLTPEEFKRCLATVPLMLAEARAQAPKVRVWLAEVERTTP